jgi:hypothetical protein
MTSNNRELEQWMEMWHASSGAEAPVTPEAVRAHVERRSRSLAVWLAGEVAVSVCAAVFLLHRAVTHPDLFEKISMGLLAFIVVSAMGLSLWNWRGVVRASMSTTSGFVGLSCERLRRFRRAIRVGWGLLVGEVAVFVPWVWHQLYGGSRVSSDAAERFGWSWLAGVTMIGVVLLVGLEVWARREDRILNDLRKELEGDDVP